MDMQAAFEAATCGAGRTGTCIRQASPQAAIPWKVISDPYAEIGSTNWNNYTVSTDTMLEKSGFVEVLGRVGAQELNHPLWVNAYHLRVSDSGAWSIYRSNTSGQNTTLRSGNTASLGTNRWHTVALGFSGSTITATVDGTSVGSVSDSTFGSGVAGIGTSQGETAQFDNLAITNGGTPTSPTAKPPTSPPPTPSQPPAAPPPTGGSGGVLRGIGPNRCLNVPNGPQTDGTFLQIYDCN